MKSTFRVSVMLALGVWVVSAPASSTATAGSGGENSSMRRGHEKIALIDECDPSDPTWAATGGCLLKEGTVTNAQFAFFSRWTNPTTPPPGSPLAKAVIGHPAWLNSPGYLVMEEGDDLRVTNEGGRGHTFTPVAEFGGGYVPPLSFGLTQAPECATAQGTVMEPGARNEIEGLPVGDHKFQCCIHPWMRSLVKVQPEEDE